MLLRLGLVLFAVLVAAGVVAATDVSEAGAQSVPYSQVVDNTTPGRFYAPKNWGSSSYSTQRYGSNYRFTRPGSTWSPAYFRLRIPARANYAVYARWPAHSGYNDRTAFGIYTANGWVGKRVNQRVNGGKWMYLGTYTMNTGDGWYMMVSNRSPGSGYIVADAVKVVQVSGTTSRQAVVDHARTYIGTRYVRGYPNPCSKTEGMDCECLTRRVFEKFSVRLPDDPALQYKYGAPSNGAPGDLVFFNEAGTGISHVGIASGNGKIIHASSYFGKVVESEMKYIKGYVGARRLL